LKTLDIACLVNVLNQRAQCIGNLRTLLFRNQAAQHFLKSRMDGTGNNILPTISFQQPGFNPILFLLVERAARL
jgi:hypothetical protein